jgi:hypothetical protein
MALAACNDRFPSDQPVFHDPHETRVVGWTGIDASSLVPEGRVGYITGVLRDTGQSLITLGDFIPAPDVRGNELTALVSPGPYFVLIDECTGTQWEGAGGVYEAEVLNGSHAVPVVRRSVQYWDARSGGLNCTGSPGAGASPGSQTSPQPAGT